MFHKIKDLNFPIIKNNSLKKFEKKSTFRQFTLVELIVVILIISVLMAISIPAFTDMMKGGGVVGGTRNISQMLKLARTYAINNNEYVAVLFPMYDKDPRSDFSGLNENYFNRSYRVCLVTRDNSDYIFKRWINGENWEFLPVGIAFFEVDGDDKVNSGTPQNDSPDVVQKVNYADIGGIKIESTGPNYDTVAVIFKPSGRMATSEERYVEIGEGVFAGGKLILTNTEYEAYMSVMIDKYTGRVSVLNR